MLLMSVASLMGAFSMGLWSSQEWIEANPEVVFRKLIPEGQPWPEIKDRAQDPPPPPSDLNIAQNQANQKDFGVQLLQSTLSDRR